MLSGNGAQRADSIGVSKGGGSPADSDLPESTAAPPSLDAPNAFEIKPSGRVIRDAADGLLYRFDEGPWIRLNTSFRDKWLRTLKGPELSLFLCLALHIDDSNHAFPSMDRISMLTGYSIRHIRRALHAAEKRGWLEIRRTPGGHNRYTLHAPVSYGYVGGDKMSSPSTRTPDTGVIGPGTPESGQGGHGRPPKKIQEVEPRKKRVRPDFEQLEPDPFWQGMIEARKRNP